VSSRRSYRGSTGHGAARGPDVDPLLGASDLGVELIMHGDGGVAFSASTAHPRAD
jgi:hypothetical protein